MPIVENFKQILSNIVLLCHAGGGRKLRSYQQEIANAVMDSVLHGRGLTFVVMLPRQSGKNELQAHLEAYLMTVYSRTSEKDLVKVSPTWKPQSINAMRRLERVLAGNLITKTLWQKESGYIYRIGKVRTSFFSGAPTANIVGATASLLLECDEAQDVEISKWDRDCAPMAASTNATRIFWGTAWTSKTLLARELRAAREAEKLDGIQRVFVRNGEQVGLEVKAYMRHLHEQVARLGRQHPMVKTQYYSEEIDAEGGMFPPARRALMWGEHVPHDEPRPDRMYAFTIDVAGEDEGATLDPDRMDNPRRDATALTVFDVQLRPEDPARPLYRVVARQLWTGTKHTALFPRLRALVETWRPRFIVVDATGIGSGLATYFESFQPGNTIRFDFSSASKSRLGWDFIALIETGRYKEAAWPSQFDPRQHELIRQMDACLYEIHEGPGKLMKWGVPDGTRDPSTGEYLHDDLILSAALACVLDEQVWGDAHSRIATTQDPLKGLRF